MKYLYLNKDNVIIDIVDIVKYVEKNGNGLIVLCREDKAQGYIGSDNNTVYPKIGTQLVSTFNDVCGIVEIDNIDDTITPLAYKYDYEANEVVENTEAYPLDNMTLSQQIMQQTANIEYIIMMSDIDI